MLALHYCHGKCAGVFSIIWCRKLLELEGISCQALKCHLAGSKHLEALGRPRQDPKDFFLQNGKWKRRKGKKRRNEGDGEVEMEGGNVDW